MTAAGLLTLSECLAKEYVNHDLGIRFSYPENVTLDLANVSESPLNVPFVCGEPPFEVTIVLKDTGVEDSVSDFLSAEHEQQKAGGYFGEVVEEKHRLPDGRSAVELVRKTPIGTIYYFVFEVPKTPGVAGLWLVTSDAADPEGNAVEAYTMMRDSLSVAE